MNHKSKSKQLLNENNKDYIEYLPIKVSDCNFYLLEKNINDLFVNREFLFEKVNYERFKIHNPSSTLKEFNDRVSWLKIVNNSLALAYFELMEKKARTPNQKRIYKDLKEKWENYAKH